MLFNLDLTHINTFILPEIFSAIFILSLGILALLNNRKNITNLSFALWCLILSGHCFSVFFIDRSANIITAAYWTRIGYAFLIFFIPGQLGFIFSFVKLKFKRLLLVVLYLVSSLFLGILLYTPYFLESVIISQDPYFPYQPLSGIAYLIYALLFFGSIIISFLLLAKARKESSGYKQTQISYLMAAFIIGGILAIFGMSMIFLRMSSRLAYTVPYFGASAYAFLVAYAILKYRLMDITVVIRKSLAYSLIIGLFTGIYLAAVLVLTQLFQNIVGFNSLFIAAVVVIAFALSLQPLKDKTQEWVDRVFFKSKYNYQQTLKELSHASTSMIDLDRLLKLVSKTIVDRININGTSIYTIDKNGLAFDLKESYIKEG